MHFIDKTTSIEIINNIQNKIKNNGIIVISLFIEKDGFEKQELLRLCKDFEIIYYYESIIADAGHPGQTEKHTHQVSRIIARKKINKKIAPIRNKVKTL